MPDISLCSNFKENGCTLKDKCYRATAKVKLDMYQSYMDFKFDKKKKECDFFISNKNRK